MVAGDARALFEAGEFDRARAAFERAFALGDASADTVAALQALLADAGDHEALARLLTDYLDRMGPDLRPRERVAWAAALFDAASVAGADGSSAETALRLLEAAAAAGAAGWGVVLEPPRRGAIEAACRTPAATLERLEQEGYAPAETGLPALARAQAEEIGFRHAAEPEVARAAERLLHALGERDAAYRVEAARRSAGTTDRRPDPRPRETARPDLGGLVVVLVGGHAALRSAVRLDLQRSGVRAVRSVPAAWEATRSGRAVRDALAEADVAVLIRPQVAHSTADQVRSAAGPLGVPVVVAPTAAAAAIRRAVEAFAARRETGRATVDR